ncbi:MAG TPA: hypothetical protein VHE80_11955 [Acidimicrobiales bacterium]|nr:hypothetical protein [Acidimicrobiales bacterium]
MLAWLSRLGVARGFMGGSRVWTAVGSAAFALRLLKRLTGAEPKVVFSRELHDGESLLISHDRTIRVRRAPR